MTTPLPLTLEAAKELYAQHETAHAFDHVMRVYKLAERIARGEGADLRIVLTAVLLHDVVHSGPDHHLASAALARKVLVGEPPAFVEAVVHCIEAHRFRAGPVPNTLEAQVVFDADKLDALGAVGVARAFAYAGHRGSRLWAPLREVAEAPPPTGPDYTPVHEFWHKLRRLPEMLYTATARALAQERYAFMEAFFRRLDEECTGTR